MGLRSFFKRVLPGDHEIRDHKQLRILGTILHDPNIFHITRRSAAGGTAVGLFIAGMPIPGHMLVAALLAIYFRVNLPLAVLLVWMTNPLTLAPYLYLAYKTGAFLLNLPAGQIEFEFTLAWAGNVLHGIWQPLLLGCVIYSTIAAITGYFAMRGLWRLVTIRKWVTRNRSNQGR